MNKNTFPGFHLPVQELSAFSVVEDIFILSTKQNKLVTFYCKEAVSFQQWLEQNHVRDVKRDTDTAGKKVSGIMSEPAMTA
ncbi:MAG TPA: hypothetical protein VL093_11705 [Flavipsychrobacter sp.]|jgi:hypothetical protein|nr:hypothetical protein [Flavipsychrobacter sp.]